MITDQANSNKIIILYDYISKMETIKNQKKMVIIIKGL